MMKDEQQGMSSIMIKLSEKLNEDKINEGEFHNPHHVLTLHYIKEAVSLAQENKHPITSFLPSFYSGKFEEELQKIEDRFLYRGSINQITAKIGMLYHDYGAKVFDTNMNPISRDVLLRDAM